MFGTQPWRQPARFANCRANLANLAEIGGREQQGIGFRAQEAPLAHVRVLPMVLDGGHKQFHAECNAAQLAVPPNWRGVAPNGYICSHRQVERNTLASTDGGVPARRDLGTRQYGPSSTGPVCYTASQCGATLTGS